MLISFLAMALPEYRLMTCSLSVLSLGIVAPLLMFFRLSYAYWPNFDSSYCAALSSSDFSANFSAKNLSNSGLIESRWKRNA